MGVTPGTIEDVQRAFERAVMAMPHCRATHDLTDYDRLFRSVLDPVWVQVSESVQQITIDPRTSIFRVACKVRLDSHGDGIGCATVKTMQGITDSLASVAEKATGVVVRIAPASVEEAPFGKTITLMAQGIIER